MKVLIVDDDIVCRSLLLTILKDFGELEVAISADEAIKAYDLANKSADPYDLIFLDRVMPGKIGDDVLLYIRNYENENNFRSFERVNVIMVTGLKKPDQVFASFRHQCEGYIIKPITKDKVFKAMKSCGIEI